MVLLLLSKLKLLFLEQLQSAVRNHLEKGNEKDKEVEEEEEERGVGGGGGEEEEAISTHLFSFIHGLQNGHVEFLQSRQDVDVFPQVRSEVF